jgi:phytoene dehydrogenase-like protein
MFALLKNPCFLVAAAIVIAVVTTVYLKKDDDLVVGNLTQNSYDVIVIGSGIAGTSAANDLAKNGKKVLILEASGYIGGRTKSTSVTLNDNSTFWFEEGANWIHGRSAQNPLTDLATKVPNVKYIVTDEESMVFYGEDGTNVDAQMSTEEGEYPDVF